METKAVIFDMDGVLIDAREWHYDALNRSLAHFGYIISRYDHLVTYDGLPTKDKLKMLSKEQELPEKLHQYINDLKQQYTTEIVHARCKPTFQHEYALAALKNRGLKLAVASNSIRSTVNLMMEKSDLERYLDLQLSNEDVAKSKPDPEIYIKAMDLLGVSPQETLIVEDNPHGVAAARASQARVLVVKDVVDVNLANIDRAINQAQ